MNRSLAQTMAHQVKMLIQYIKCCLQRVRRVRVKKRKKNLLARFKRCVSKSLLFCSFKSAAESSLDYKWAFLMFKGQIKSLL